MNHFDKQSKSIAEKFIASIASKYRLTELAAVENISFNYVLSGLMVY